MTQEELADRSVVLNQKNISDFENGRVDLRETSVSRAAALARALNWTLYELQDATGLDLGLGRNPNSTVISLGSPTLAVYPLAAANNPSLPAYQHPVALKPKSDGTPHPPNLRVYVMNSDEMTVPGQRSLAPGDYVVMDADDTRLEPGGQYVIVRNGEVHVRRYKETEMGNGFYADNISYDPIPASSSRVVGRVYRLWPADHAPSLN